MIVIVDYNIGNIVAVSNMFQRLGVFTKISSNPLDIEQASHIILPGNGSFDACMINLRATGLIPIIKEQVLNKKVPLLGICVGAQMLGRGSAEGVEPGLGWLNMQVERFPSMQDLPIPHMGWNYVEVQADNKITEEMTDETRFYFIHSYFMKPDDPEDVLLTSNYGIKFAAAVARGNIIGVQFHPEKSHRFGKQLIKAFARSE